MDPKTAVTTYFSKYVDFSGRARRSEFWWGYLALLIALVVVVAVAAAIGVNALIYLAYLGALPAFLSSGVRRLHDTGKSGWLMLLSIVPFGGIALLVFFVMDSEAQDNRYGRYPKAALPYGQVTPPPVGA